MKKLKNIDLKSALADAEAELIAVVKRAETLREWITATKKLCGKNLKNAEGIEGDPVVRRRTRNTTLAQQVRDLLSEVGKPMHVDDIVEALKNKGHEVNAQNPKATVAVALTRRVDQFTKVKPNTFALVTQPSGTEVVKMAS